MSIQIQTKSLRRASGPDRYKLYRAALEWDLIEPIVIESRDDLRSERQWRDKVEPFYHQVTNLMAFCRKLPVTLLADDVGLGKTISAGLILSELIARGRVAKVLIVCPKLLIHQWAEELFSKFGIAAISAVGRDLITPKFPEEGGAVITTYQSARIHFKDIAKAGYDMLILDEAHKLRNLYGTEEPPLVAIRFRQALADRMFKYVLMLTATPIQNRLWDLYSLVDLLTVARGHENPFGTEGMFARKFIADGREKARQLRPESQQDFRDIVYGYMSRVRRADAKLAFPNRVVQLHRVPPSEGELQLIEIIGAAIQKMNRLAQISILQALISSPDALAAQLENMAKNGTFPKAIALQVRGIAREIKITAKLKGLLSLVEDLRKERPKDWRMVVFTWRRETQTTIEAYLGSQGIKCGLINGQTGPKNQETITKFKNDPPEINVIVSTEAGSEGINLQAANVLVNYDLPWNPMIVEQRIGRIQRLNSKHATVCIFNIILQGTFEEYIVGRLMEKLQMASHAIGDVESLLEAAGMDEAEGSRSFADKIRDLVVKSLSGLDVEKATKLAIQSITEAKIELEREEETINSMLSGEGMIDLGPKSPKLPAQIHSMDARTFVFATLKILGANVLQEEDSVYRVELEGKTETIRFEEEGIDGVTDSICKPNSFFERLVNNITNSPLHLINDLDETPAQKTKDLIMKWAEEFGAQITNFRIDEAWHHFVGTAILRARVYVAHDSYERLIEVDCKGDGKYSDTVNIMKPFSEILENPKSLGLNFNELSEKVLCDSSISEFCRFYEERLSNEIDSAGDDSRKRKKLQDDFTPRIEIALVALEGTVNRKIRARTSYKFDNSDVFESSLVLIPLTETFLSSPETDKCSLTGKTVPEDCLQSCAISQKKALRHLLIKSEISNRKALPEYIVTCALSGKRVLSDEIEVSSISGKAVAANLLKTSVASRKKAEPEFFGKCEFTGSEVLDSELAISQISNKRYRADEQAASIISGKSGHRLEFINCAQTKQPLLAEEAVRCQVTGKLVVPTIIETCSVSGKKVLPSELEICAVTHQKALKEYFVTCAISKKQLLVSEAQNCEETGKSVMPGLLEKCEISNRMVLPSELETSSISGKRGLKKYFTTCALTKQRLLASEAESCEVTASKVCPGMLRKCEVSHKRVLPNLIEQSAISGKFALKEYFVTCPLTSNRLLASEAEKCEVTGAAVCPGLLKQCEISGKKVLPSLLEKSFVSGKNALKEYFVTCSETGHRLLSSEADKCELTNVIVVPGLLEECTVSCKKVLPRELDKSDLSGKKALKRYFVISSISSLKLLEQESVRSKNDKFCSLDEAKNCTWSGTKYHPDDMRLCSLAHVPLHFEKIGVDGKNRFAILSDLLNGSISIQDSPNSWKAIESAVSNHLNVKGCKIDSAMLSPDGNHIAACIEIKSWLGIKVRYAGCVFSIQDQSSVGTVVVGKRSSNGWITEEEEKTFEKKGSLTCPKCKEKNNPTFKTCWKCQTSLH